MKLWPFIFAAAANLFWAGNAIVGKLAASTIAPFSLSFYRWLLACIILLPFAWVAVSRQRQWYWQERKLIFALAILSVTVFNTFQYLALNFTAPTNVSMVIATMPIFILALTSFMQKQSIKKHQWLGTGTALVGVLMVIWQGGGKAGINPGDLIMVLAVFCFALYSVLLKRVPEHISPTGLTFVLMAVGTLGILPFYLWDLYQQEAIPWADWETWYILIYVATLPSIGSYYCWNYAVKKGGPILTGLSINLLPVFTLILSIALLGTALNGWQVLPIGLIFAGVWQAMGYPLLKSQTPQQSAS